MRIAIVHPWFLALGGAEQSVGIIAEMYPNADIFTLFSAQSGLPSQLQNRKITPCKWNFLPGKYRFYRHLLPIYAAAFESIDLRGYDLVLSSDSCVIKGVLLDDETTHVCFCHSPMRCLYDQYREYLEELPWFARPIFKFATRYLRTWDFIAAQRVTGFATNSKYIAQRVRSYYGLESEVVYAPVQTNKGYIDLATKDYYLSVGRLVRSKRVDLLIQACNWLGRQLIIVGSGRELSRLKKIAGPTIQFAGRVSATELPQLYARCKALLFAAKEDFGIVPLECQSYGRPVIAYAGGGALETVIPHVTGLHFNEQTAGSLVKAITLFESEKYDPIQIQANARMFDTQEFKRRFSAFVDICIQAKQTGRPWTEIPRARKVVSKIRRIR